MTPDENMPSGKQLEVRQDANGNYHYVLDPTVCYCTCRDCVKYCCCGAPLMCVDPYLVDMRHTHWIYYGLLDASKTARVRTASMANPNSTEEPQAKREKH